MVFILILPVHSGKMCSIGSGEGGSPYPEFVNYPVTGLLISYLSPSFNFLILLLFRKIYITILILLFIPNHIKQSAHQYSFRIPYLI
jgi:hypothetical protein